MTILVNWTVLLAYLPGGFILLGEAAGIAGTPLATVVFLALWLAGAVAGTILTRRGDYPSAVLAGMGGPMFGLALAEAIL
ncbi:hypothetical protein Afil01_59360 [Actinorhabdospora filicis]|uniref:Uncharacterized protein n=1 Tax=Actinorhabdospora filicis TaxID=1785913 RepID=A0A9W6SSG1_9ACTN|nr:hypothetical protein Afil01_59360 [Actinorhabdospora filicis]